MIVVNASPLIVLGKQGKLLLLKQCFQKILVPQGVVEEINQKKDSPEALALQQAIKERWISTKKTTISPLLDTEKLGRGEKEAISLAKAKGTPVLLDDDLARAYAAPLNVEVQGTLYVLILACQKKIIDKESALTLLDSMMADGFYISTEIYKRFQDVLQRTNDSGCRIFLRRIGRRRSASGGQKRRVETTSCLRERS